MHDTPPPEGSKIKMLTTVVANKIAAGEVVERPASALKELLENALDAGATRIDVIVNAGGRKLISVADNGSGMNRDDALMAPERQATSKIRDVDDIERIATFGFRGEALPSIASVSRFTLSTRRRGDDAGTRVEITGGKLTDVADCGCPPGTCVEVRDLFFNVPARRNFLRAFATEQAHVRNTFMLHAVANPGVAMSLKLDGDSAFQLSPCENLLDRIRELFGADETERLVPVDRATGRIRVFGYAGIPTWTRADRAGQRVYINRRPATAPTVQAAISAAYPRMDGEKKPIVFLFIDLPPDQVDVNVHPTKREVRFRNNTEVRDAVIAALGGALEKGGARSPSAPEEAVSARPPHLPPPITRHFDFPSTPPQAKMPAEPEKKEKVSTDTFVETPPGAPWKRFRLIGRLASGFALLETEDGLVVLDPAASHERVIYEKLLGEIEGVRTMSQTLLFPQTVEMAPLDFRRVENILRELRELGFGISAFEKKAFIVDALPDVVSDVPCNELLPEIAAAYEQAGQRRGREKIHGEIIAKAASRTAVRLSGRIDDTALLAIICDLARCVMPYASPSGRPTTHLVSTNELNRRFGRS
ncbi:MAG: DNA mismatch repair endonuclease MutL [Kiritimatiellaeota bacterium]|nr:DNA mismatch repair endonuclease MutL [Kiritimatiellota bacterium]